MVDLGLSLADALGLRFTISPLGETVRLARAIANPALFAKGARLDWLRHHRARLARLLPEQDLAPLLALLAVPREQQPGFLTPTPTAPIGDIEGELARLRATPRTQVDSEIRRSLDHLPGLDPAAARFLRNNEAAPRLADHLQAIWDELVAPSWPHLRDPLERDILHPSRVFAEGGLATMFADLEPLVTLHEQRLLLERSAQATRELGGTGLRLIPSAFVWPDLDALLTQQPPTLVYPARGAAALFCDRRSSQSTLDKLIGRTRSEILAAVGERNRSTP